MILKRTFEAKEYPKGSKERKRLNQWDTTSEYMPSYKWVYVSPEGSRYQTRTKREAEEKERLN